MYHNHLLFQTVFMKEHDVNSNTGTETLDQPFAFQVTGKRGSDTEKTSHDHETLPLTPPIPEEEIAEEVWSVFEQNQDTNLAVAQLQHEAVHPEAPVADLDTNLAIAQIQHETMHPRVQKPDVVAKVNREETYVPGKMQFRCHQAAYNLMTRADDDIRWRKKKQAEKPHEDHTEAISVLQHVKQIAFAVCYQYTPGNPVKNQDVLHQVQAKMETSKTPFSLPHFLTALKVSDPLLALDEPGVEDHAWNATKWRWLQRGFLGRFGYGAPPTLLKNT